jgi:ABC-type phosphate transport system substrate-binding protein
MEGPRMKTLSVVVMLSLASAGLAAQTPSAPQSKTAAHMARLPHNPPEWDANGRPLPTPELWQPRLDDALPDFHPRFGRNFSGHIVSTSFNILPGLVDAWITAFRTYYPNVQVENPKPYSARGPHDLIQGTVDCAFVSRELEPSDVAAFQAKYGYPPTSIPVAGGSYRHYGFLDAMVFIVNRDNPIEKINYQQLDAIFSSTRYRGGRAPITTWGQLGLEGKWADRPIHAYGIKPWNGFEEFIRERILSVGNERGEWGKQVDFVSDVVMPVPLWVAWDPDGIGYSGVVYMTEGTKPLALSVTPHGPYVAPTYKEIALARYPLARVSYLDVNKRPGRPLPAALAEFARFITSQQGQQIVLDQGIFLPLRAGQSEASRALLGSR